MAQNIYHIAPGAGLAFATAVRHRPAVRPRTSSRWPTPRGPRSSSTMSATLERPLLPARSHQPGDQHGHLSGRLLLLLGRQRVQPRVSVELPRRQPAPSTGLGTGTFQNFDGNGGTSLLLPITVNVANTSHRLPVRPALGHRRSPREGLAQRPRSISTCSIPAATSSPPGPTTTSPRGAAAGRDGPLHGQLLRRDPVDFRPRSRARRVHPVRRSNRPTT